MDDDAKARTLMRCVAIESRRLNHVQNGKKINSKHFDLKPLIDALQSYVGRFDMWFDNSLKWPSRDSAWMNVGMAQRDLPAHVINEYYRKDRTFYPLPSFHEESLPRDFTYYNLNTNKTESLFPLVISDSSGLGVDFSLSRGAGPSASFWPDCGSAVGGKMVCGNPRVDIMALSRLDRVRTNGLKQSLENLKPSSPSLDI
jgi:hypothetical protein